METYEVKRVNGPIHWTVEVPGSKSITNRALLMAALARGTVKLKGVLFSDDSRYFLSSLSSLGYTVRIDEEHREVEVEGCAGTLPCMEGEIYVGSAGTAARFLTAMLGVSKGCFVIQASPQMKKRPMKPLFEALIALGAKVEWLEQEWHLPVRMTGAGVNGTTGQTVMQLDISESTQFLSAFLLISPLFTKGLKIEITSEKKDGSYIRITRRMMEEFGVQASFDGSVYEVGVDAGYKRAEYQIEPDVSAACYFYGAAAITGGTATVKHVHSDGMQGDLKFLKVLEQMGCTMQECEEGIAITGPKDGQLKGVEIDMNDFSDQALTLAAIAPYAVTPVTIRNIAHIRGQECDRIHAIASNLSRAGIVCEEYPDVVKIEPGAPKPCSIETFEDHRVAMAFSLLGLRSEGILIENPSCCKKTFEQYFEILDLFCRKLT
jgi:3-phosphoshikimate 1-carboxyvinyltransferase